MIKDQVYYWPIWLLTARAKGKNSKIKSSLLKKISQGQIYLWKALNIYDDFLDGSGQPNKLSRANAYLRRYLEIYYRLNLGKDFYRLFNSVFADLEKANQEEAVQTHLEISQGQIIFPRVWPNFKNLTDLSRKSLVLALGPLVAANFLAERPDQGCRSAILDFFRFALAAKQLSDDACDWREDLENGAITAVNILILKKARQRHLTLNLQKPEVINLLFVSAAASQIAGHIKTLCWRARREAKKAGWLNNCALIREIIKPLENAVVKSEKFRSLLTKKA